MATRGSSCFLVVKSRSTVSIGIVLPTQSKLTLSLYLRTVGTPLSSVQSASPPFPLSHFPFFHFFIEHQDGKHVQVMGSQNRTASSKGISASNTVFRVGTGSASPSNVIIL